MSLSSAYLLHCVHLPSSNLYAVSTSAPVNNVLLVETESHRIVQQLAHPDAITCLRVAQGAQFHGNQERLITSCKDGIVRIWDLQSGLSTAAYSTSPPRPILCFDISSDLTIIAAGTELTSQESHLVYFSISSSKPAWVHTSTHSDDITAVHFLPSSSLVLSASTDGLICISDASVSEEEEAGVFVSNWGCSIAQAGIIGGDTIWAASDMETFSLWSSELDKIADISIKSDCPSVPSSVQSDYLVTVSSQPRGILVGSNEGVVALLSLPDSTNSSLSLLATFPKPLFGPRHSTETVVRSAAFLADRERMITVGEDGRLCAWNWSSNPGPISVSSRGKLGKRTLDTADSDDDIEGVDMDTDGSQEITKVKKRRKSGVDP